MSKPSLNPFTRTKTVPADEQAPRTRSCHPRAGFPNPAKEMAGVHLSASVLKVPATTRAQGLSARNDAIGGQEVLMPAHRWSSKRYGNSHQTLGTSTVVDDWFKRLGWRMAPKWDWVFAIEEKPYR